MGRLAIDVSVNEPVARLRVTVRVVGAGSQRTAVLFRF